MICFRPKGVQPVCQRAANLRPTVAGARGEVLKLKSFIVSIEPDVEQISSSENIGLSILPITCQIYKRPWINLIKHTISFKAPVCSPSLSAELATQHAIAVPANPLVPVVPGLSLQVNSTQPPSEARERFPLIFGCTAAARHEPLRCSLPDNNTPSPERLPSHGVESCVHSFQSTA